MRSLKLALAATALVPALALSGCSDSDASSSAGSGTPSADAAQDAGAEGTAAPAAEVEVVKDLAGVDVDTKDTKKPKVTLKETPLAVDRSQMQVVLPGTGDKITKDMAVTIDYVLVNARDGKQVQSTFEAGQPEVVTMNAAIPGMVGSLVGQQVGAKLVTTLTPQDSFAAQGGIPQMGVKVSDPVVVYMVVTSAKKPLTKAEGTVVPPKAGLPTVTFKDAAPASIAVPKGAAAPTEMVAQPLIEGKGTKVAKGQMLTVTYTGVVWSTGKMFDSSFKTGEPAQFPIGTGGVIPCWDKGLVGKTIGSRYLLVCPAKDAYGAQKKGDIPANATLVFVVDILDAATQPAAPAEPAAPAANPTAANPTTTK